MKIPLLLVLAALAGCQSPPAVVPPAPPPPAATDNAPSVEPALELRLRRQTQWVEALMSQNEALRAQLRRAAEKPPMQVAATGELPPMPDEVPGPHLTPNTDGLIDLTATVPADDANPFAVRKVPDDAVREVSLHLAGIVAGARPCAVINERLVEAGDTIAGFAVVRVEPAAVVLEFRGQRLRLPLTGKPARIRLAS